VSRGTKVASVAESFAVDLTSDTLWFPVLVVDVVMTAIVTTVGAVAVAATKCVNTSRTKCDLATLINKSETKKLFALLFGDAKQILNLFIKSPTRTASISLSRRDTR
jgi:hypothetical protein